MSQPELWGEFYRAIATEGGKRKWWARSQEEWDWERGEAQRAKREADLANQQRYREAVERWSLGGVMSA